MDNSLFKSHSQRSMESRKKTSDQIQFVVPKGQREIIRSFAKKSGVSLNEYIRQAINEKMERDG